LPFGSSVSQGIILGALLLIICMNDLVATVSLSDDLSGRPMYLYADDTELFEQ